MKDRAVRKLTPQDPNYEVSQSINAFFCRRRWHNGGPIPPNLLHTKANYNLVRNINLVQAIDIGYKAIADHLAKGPLARTRGVKHADIYLVTRVMRACEKVGVQQEHIGGIFLLYLELCERVRLPR